MPSEVKRLTVEQVKSTRRFFEAVRKLKLSTYRQGLKETVDFCERLDYCRFINEHKYNKNCRHAESAPNYIAES